LPGEPRAHPGLSKLTNILPVWNKSIELLFNENAIDENGVDKLNSIWYILYTNIKIYYCEILLRNKLTFKYISFKLTKLGKGKL